MAKTCFRQLNFDSGFAMAQSLVGAAIVAIIAMVLMAVVGNLSDMSGRYAVKEQITTAAQLAQAILIQEKICSQALRFSNAPVPFDGVSPSPVSTILNPDLVDSSRSVPALQSNTIFSSLGNATRVILGQMTLEPSAAGANPVTEVLYDQIPDGTGRMIPQPVTYNMHIARLLIPSSTPNPTTGAFDPDRALATQSLGLKLYVDPNTGRVARCFSLSNDDQTCSAFGGYIGANGRCLLPPCDASTPGALTCPPVDPRFTCVPIVNSIPPATQIYVWVFAGKNPGDPPEFNGLKCLCIQSCGL